MVASAIIEGRPVPVSKLEKDIERKLRRAVERLGGKCLKWVCPGWSGVPDRLILLPGGRICFVELKRPSGGVVAPLQSKWREWLENLGFTVWVVRDEADLEFVLLLIQKYTDERGML